MFNKYYEDSLAKSILVNNFGRKYFKMLKNNNLNILTLTFPNFTFSNNLFPYDLQIKIFKLIYYLYSSKES